MMIDEMMKTMMEKRIEEFKSELEVMMKQFKKGSLSNIKELKQDINRMDLRIKDIVAREREKENKKSLKA